MKTEITFFCELRAHELKKLFEDRFVFDDLKTLNAGISLGILDLSSERANVVQKLNRLGIPVTAWLLLPEGIGLTLAITPKRRHAIRSSEHGARKTSLSGQRLGWTSKPISMR